MSASYDTSVCRALSSNPKMHGTTHPNFPLSTADAVGHGIFRIVSKSPDKDTASPPLNEWDAHVQRQHLSGTEHANIHLAAAIERRWACWICISSSPKHPQPDIEDLAGCGTIPVLFLGMTVFGAPFAGAELLHWPMLEAQECSPDHDSGYIEDHSRIELSAFVNASEGSPGIHPH